MNPYKIRVASLFSLYEMAIRIAGFEKTGYVKKIKGKYHVKSRSNPSWSGGVYDTKEEAERRLKTVEMFKHLKGKKKS